MLEQIIKIGQEVRHIPLSGVLNGRFYHTVFLYVGSKHSPFLLFGKGDYFSIKHAEKESYSYVVIEGNKYIFNIGERLWYSEGLVNGVNHEGVRMVIEKESITAQELFSELITTLNEYYDFYCDEELDIVAAHLIHSYILGLLGKTFYLLLDGDKGTGKSSLQNLIALLQMNGCFCGKSSTASIVRKVNSLMANINLDELDKIDPKDLHVLIGVMNSGLYRNGTYEITDMNAKKSEGQIRVYKTYSTKTFSTNKSIFHDSFMSRCVVIHTIRNRKPIRDIYSRDEQEDEKFQMIRNKVFAYCLINSNEFSEAIKKSQLELENKGIYGRRTDIFAIICGVLKVMKGDYDSVLKYLIEKDEMKVEEDEEKDRLYHILSHFCGLIERGECSIRCTNEELKQIVCAALNINQDDQYAPSSSSIGSLLKRSKIVTSKAERKRNTTGSGAGKGTVYYEIRTEKVKDIILRSDYSDLIERIRRIEVPLSTLLPSLIDKGLTHASVSEVFGEVKFADEIAFTAFPKAINDP